MKKDEGWVRADRGWKRREKITASDIREWEEKCNVGPLERQMALDLHMPVIKEILKMRKEEEDA